MIASIAWAVMVSGLAMLPGWIIANPQRPALRVAWCTVSLVIATLAVALAGVTSHALGLGQLPAAAIIPASLIMVGVAWRYRTPCPLRAREWQGWAFAAAFAVIGLACFALATAWLPDGTLLVHSWYNADGFKHLGHIHALANWGVPARDIFGNGGPLYYYWLSYVIPGAATALGGDAVAAGLTWNAIIAALFGLLLYEIIRYTGARPSIALATAGLAIFVTLPSGYALNLLSGTSMTDMLMMPFAPKGPALLALSQFIPQHCLAAAMMLSAIIIDLDEDQPPVMRWISWIAFAAILTVSTLLGSMLMLAYGFFRLCRDRQRSLVPLAAIGGFALFFVVVLHVLALFRPGSAIESPLFANALPDLGPGPLVLAAALKIVGHTGLPLLLALYVFARGPFRGETARSMRVVGTGLIAAAFILAALSAAVLPTRINIELIIRAPILIGVAVAIAGGWAIEHAWRSGRAQKGMALAIIAAVTAVAAPGAYVRIAWMAKFDDSQYTTRVPADDLAVLAYLRNNSLPTTRVWQFPEPPVLAFEPGGDAWVAVLAGRAVPNSLRATDFAAAAPYLTLSKAFFSGQPAAIPAEMDWVYLSRALHPATFDELVQLLRTDPDWLVPACYPNACLFSRRAASER